MSKIKELENILKEYSTKNNLNYFLNNVNLELDELKVSIALLGEFSTGKSTLVNALLGKRILPALERPTSATIVEITGGDELRAYCQKDNEFEEIEISEISDFVMGSKSQTIDKVLIEIPHNDFINKDVKIIDTPGISSINNIHDDITFGYLPFIDAAIIVLNANQGGSTGSLVNFLKEKIIVEGQLSKMIFALNFADTKSEEEIKNISNELKEQLLPIIKNPEIVAISALSALEGDFEKSNLNEFKKILNDKILGEKAKLIAERKEKILKNKVKDLISLLSEQLNALVIDNSSLDVKIENIKKDISSLDKEKNRIKNVFEEFRQNTNNHLLSTISRYTDILLDKAMQNKTEELDINITNLTNELSDYLNKQFKQLNTSVNISLENIPEILKSKLEQAISNVRDTIDTISPILTGLIIAALTGPAGILGTEVASESALVIIGKKLRGIKTIPKKSSALKEALGQILPMVSSFVEEIDIPNKALKLGAKAYIAEDVKNQLQTALIASIDVFIKELQDEVDKSLTDKIIKPQEDLEKQLIDIRESKKFNLENTLKAKEQIEKDINDLNSLV